MVGNNVFTSTKVGFEAVYSSIQEVHKPHVIHPEDADKRLHVPPKTFYPYNPPTYTAPLPEHRTYDIRRSDKSRRPSKLCLSLQALEEVQI